MSYDRAQRVAVSPQGLAGKLPIGPQDYFVLSRIDGKSSVGDVVDSAGLPSATVQEILARLVELGAVVLLEGGERPKAQVHTAPIRARVSNRRRQTLVDGLSGTGARGTPPVADKPPPTPAREEPAVEVYEAPAFTLPPASGTDPRLDPSLRIDLQEQRALLALVDGSDALTPFELLGLHPTNDMGVIKKAFHLASRRFHPDAYHGRDLGEFHEHLSQLFSAAKLAHSKLRDDAFRTPLVEAYERERNATREQESLKQKQMDAARMAAEEIRGRREREDLEDRRSARASQRAQSQRGRVLANLAGRIKRHVDDGAAAEKAGNLAAAANHYRLALGIDPNMPDVKAKWEAARTTSRRARGKEAFSRGLSYLEIGQSAEALTLFVEAADADPTLDHLANAADLLRSTDRARAREMAMGALEALNREQGDASVKPRPPAQLATLRLMIGRAFADAGQKETARRQAELAREALPDSLEVRALLKSIKVK